MRQDVRSRLNDRGVSPVIGVILMVAITVILAAVIGSFVLGIGGDVEKAPQASLTLNDTGDGIVHQGGDTIYANETTINGADFADENAVLEPGGTVGITGEDGTVRLVDESSGQMIAELET